MRPVTIETTTGKFFDFASPTDPGQINLEDIATALSNTCRFGGHVTRFYSVAEHAVRVSRWVQRVTLSESLTLAALHHDSHEAYIGDVPTPLKALMGQGFRDLADDIDQAIEDWLGGRILAEWMHDGAVKKGDEWMLRVEAATLKPSRGVGPHWGQTEPADADQSMGWDPDLAACEFINQHMRLCASL